MDLSSMYKLHRDTISLLSDDELYVETVQGTIVNQYGSDMPNYVVLYENEPCKLSDTNSKTEIEDIRTSLTEKGLLFTKPDIKIPNGSYVKIIKSTGVVFHYHSCVLDSHYPTHNEYIVSDGEIAL